MAPLIEWDFFELRVDGGKLDAMVRSMIAGTDPIERIALRFYNGMLRVEGSIRKFISIPFTAEITEIKPSGTTVRVPLRNVSAAGFSIPLILFGLIKSRLPRDLVTYEEPATLVVSLDRFLPPFVTTDVQRIWIIEGGLAVTLGKGGADLPPIHGGSDERNDSGRTGLNA